MAKAAQNLLDLLVRVPLFDGLSSTELGQLKGYLNVLSLKPGELLFREGDAGDYAGFVAEGTLRVTKDGDQGPVLLAELNVGRCLGEMGLIDNFPRSASAEAAAPTTLLLLSRASLDRLADAHPRLAYKVLKEVSRLLSLNLRKTSKQWVDRAAVS